MKIDQCVGEDDVNYSAGKNKLPKEGDGLETVWGGDPVLVWEHYYMPLWTVSESDSMLYCNSA